LCHDTENKERQVPQPDKPKRGGRYLDDLRLAHLLLINSFRDQQDAEGQMDPAKTAAGENEQSDGQGERTPAHTFPCAAIQLLMKVVEQRGRVKLV